jgi:phosphoglycerate dehydrogenase-like enzyme
VGIFGYGGVGREVARRARALQARVLAFDRESFASSDPGLESIHGPGGFGRLLAGSDFLVVTAPETPETAGAIDGAALARMKPSAVLVNLSRGRIVDEDALVAALAEGRLRGAGLDVYATEPLPSGHPLWSLPNVVMTPHVSAVSRHFWRRQTDLIVENLRRYLAGETLLNLVDKVAGY